MAKATKPKQLVVDVVFDTNVLYTGTADYFVKQEVAQLISGQADLPDLKIRWYVPEIVRHERHYQMVQEATKFLPTVQKLERLLGNPLNIGLDLLNLRVREAIDRAVIDLGLVIPSLDHAAVDWAGLIQRAVYRRPPFQAGDDEKGFRDAVILETFIQLVAAGPTSRTTRRVVLVSNDGLLHAAATDRCAQHLHVHVYRTVDELKGLINTLGSSVDEAFLNTVRASAGQLFYAEDDRKTVYYKADIGARLNQVLMAGLPLPTGADQFVTESWTYMHPRFVEKKSQRFSWITRFQASVKATKLVGNNWNRNFVFEPIDTNFGNIISSGVPSSFDAQMSRVVAPTPSTPPGKIWSMNIPPGGLLGGFQKSEPVAKGTATVDVAWTVSMTTAGNLTRPEVDGVAFVDVVWAP